MERCSLRAAGGEGRDKVDAENVRLRAGDATITRSKEDGGTAGTELGVSIAEVTASTCK